MFYTPEVIASHAHLRAYVALLIALLLISGFSYGLYLFFVSGSQGSVPVSEQANTLPNYPSTLPSLRPQDSVDQQQQFQYLVSYADSGAHPTAIGMKVGETVRFINNSSAPITLTGADGGPVPLAPGAYWQWTATGKAATTFKIGNFSVTITAA